MESEWCPSLEEKEWTIGDEDDYLTLDRDTNSEECWLPEILN